MAIMVNGKILSAPLVVGPGTEVPIQGHLTQAEAERVVNDFNRAAGKE